MSPESVILLDKVEGKTSFQALKSLKDRLDTKKIGHTGTLDRFASGLLIALSGKLTKLASLVSDLSKEYEALIQFGRETSTLDPEGEIIREAEVPEQQRVQEALAGFKGTIRQLAPAYSAVHINGKRAYQLARSGKNPELPEREVQIHSLDVLEYRPPYLRIRLHCSKGTYVRSFARDLGRACDSAAFLKELRRSKVGPFAVEEAVRAEDFKPKEHGLQAKDFLERLCNVEIAHIREGKEKAIANGAEVKPDFFDSLPQKDGLLAAFSNSGWLYAVLEKKNGFFSYRFSRGPNDKVELAG